MSEVSSFVSCSLVHLIRVSIVHRTQCYLLSGERAKKKFITMKPSTSLARGLRVAVPKVPKPLYVAPALDAISPQQLPNNDFDTKQLYSIKKTSFGQWPVYKKVQNTKITTEIKRVEGNVLLFASELATILFKGNTPKGHLRVNKLTGEVNVKGDLVSKIKTILENSIKTST